MKLTIKLSEITAAAFTSRKRKIFFAVNVCHHHRVKFLSFCAKSVSSLCRKLLLLLSTSYLMRNKYCQTEQVLLFLVICTRTRWKLSFIMMIIFDDIYNCSTSSSCYATIQLLLLLLHLSVRIVHLRNTLFSELAAVSFCDSGSVSENDLLLIVVDRGIKMTKQNFWGHILKQLFS